MRLELRIDVDEMEVGDLIRIQEIAAELQDPEARKRQSMRVVRDMIAAVVVGSDGKKAESWDEKVELVNRLTVAEMVDTLQEFNKAVVRLQDAAIPPEDGASSQAPSSTEAEAPAGSVSS